MKIKGVVLTMPKFKNRSHIYVGGIESYEKNYLEVIHRYENGDVTVLSEDRSVTAKIYAEDIMCFFPIKKENGVFMPVDLEGYDRIHWISEAIQFGIEKFNIRYVCACIVAQGVVREPKFLYEKSNFQLELGE